VADDSTFPVTLLNTTAAATLGVADFCMVIASQDSFYDSIKFHIAAGRTFTNYHVGLFKLTAPGVLTKIYTLGDVKSQLNNTRTLQVFSLPDPLDVVAGEIFYVGFLQVGGTAVSMYASNSVLPSVMPLTTGATGTTPEIQMLTTKSTGAALTNFNAATYTVLTTNTPISRPWAGLGNAIAPVRIPSYQVDTFNQINATDLALPWAFRTDLGLPTWGVYNDCAVPNVGANGAFAYRVTACRNNDHYVQVRLGADMATGPGNFDGDLYIGIRSARGGGGTSVKLHIKPNGTRVLRIISTTTAYNNGGLTQRGAMAAVPEFLAGDVVKIAAQGSVYVALLNDQPVASWNDTGVISPVDADHWWVNMMASPTAVTGMQLVDNLECGAYGGGVTLLGVSSDVSAEADGPLKFINDVTPTPVRASMEIISGRPVIQTGPAVAPAPARIQIINYAPTIELATIIQTDNNTKTNQPIPPTAVGAWVYLRGGGGGGGGGAATTVATNRYGGGGGAGGAVIHRFFLRRDQMGDVYTLVKGAGGAQGGPGASAGGDGGDSSFTSPNGPLGTLSLLANGGNRGTAGTTGGGGPPLAANGGTAVISGISPVPASTPGMAGTGRGSAANTGPANTGASVGGGSGGVCSNANNVENGYNGGNTPGAAGGIGGAAHGPAGAASSDTVLYGGGGGAGGAGSNNPTASNLAGGAGGNGGAGGGGAGATANTSPNNRGGIGGPGIAIVEWLG
jgi:hypothetical protein